MSGDEPIHPRWVLVDGVPHNVTEFAGIEPAKRPNALCPLCQKNVLLKLGSIRVHHYAHLSETTCLASQPETALHLNAKYYLYSLLLSIEHLLIERKCSRHCGTVTNEIWLQDWDEVIVEHSLGGYRPDITLLAKGQVIGAIEILVSHKVSGEKEKYFVESDIPCLEILAARVFDEENNQKWDPQWPIPYYRHFPKAEPWVCDSCKKQDEQPKVHAKQPEQLRLERTIDEIVETIESKMVDFYFPSGKKLREMYFLATKRVGGKTISAWVKNEVTFLGFEKEPVDEKSLDRLRKLVDDRINEFRIRTTVIDVNVDWRPWVPGKKYVARDTDKHPFRYSWDQSKMSWEKVVVEVPTVVNTPVISFDIKNLNIRSHEPVFEPISRVGVCKFCGKNVGEGDWIYHDGKTNEVVCRNSDCVNKMNVEIENKIKLKISRLHDA